MTTVKDLINSLQDRNPEAQVFFMTQRKQPFENHIAGVVGREEMTDQRWRFEPGIGTDDVFLVVGRRIRPGSLSAWLVAEHGAGPPREIVPTVVPEDASHAPETAFGEPPANTQGDVSTSTQAPETAETAREVVPASVPAEVSERAPEAAQIASTLAEGFPVAPEPAETSPGSPEND
jgi:hypothetical protein